MLYIVAPITEGEAAAFMDVLKQLLLFEDFFRLFGRVFVYKIEKLKIREQSMLNEKCKRG